MDDFLFLVPIALALGLAGLAAFWWTLRDGQYDDLDGASQRIFLDEQDRPLRTSQRNEQGERSHTDGSRADHAGGRGLPTRQSGLQ